MSKILLSGYAIDTNARTIDFSAVPNFDVSRLDYIYDPQTGQYYYARPRPPINWGTWNGSLFTLNPQASMPKLGPTTDLHCMADPPPSAG